MTPTGTMMPPFTRMPSPEEKRRREMMRVDIALDRARKGIFVRSWWLYLLRLDWSLSEAGFTP